jgi:tRNA A-37 threonylcarbamoyl transferase component Bud32
MAFRRFLRGEISADHIDAVAHQVAERYGDDEATVEYLEADNWLSTPIVVNEKWFVKVMSEQHSFVHALLTTGRNLGALTSGVEGFFEHFGTPTQMAEHELEATRRMRELGVNAPEPLEAFEHDGLGVLVLEYLPDFRTLDAISAEEAAGFAPDLFASLATMHDAGLAHGDLRAENVLVADGQLYFIDATSVREDAVDDARAYDLACALASLEPLIGVRETVRAAHSAYDTNSLLAAREFLDFVNLRPDHDFDAAGLKGELEKEAA